MTTAEQVTVEELNFHLEGPVSTKTDMSFINPTSIVGLQLLNLLITESNAQMRK
jgi:hypothetical protein